ncbi:hypothetical protein BN159_8076 [Streptomyces davaonensis JCM 4913]|uniref:DUF5666 domain-containing protein n=1 Tax=Streptomyces davaonensis (strain DSM 101723 / JCM 4913 / KCC S-0913 / 768) TaxID=1214101 RepID=K4RGT2_STRDJ|nr:DUF5666 domain-containing protein [Streptomyces davaonensis]CCK32454.1 hypothetical protein BN159_8076 [Streptomyces davaonensis JCM 4913]
MTHDPDQEPTAAPGEVLANGPDGERPRAPWRRLSSRTRTITAATTIAVLALGGTVAYAAGSDGGEGSTAPSASASSDAPDRPGERHHRGPWFGPGGAGVHGESTVRDGDDDEWIVRVWQRGTVQEVDGEQVTVRSEDGAEWTWTVEDDTRVHQDGDSDGLKEGDEVYLAGTRSDDGERTADHVLAGTWEKPDFDERRDRLPWRDGDDGPRHALPWHDTAA